METLSYANHRHTPRLTIASVACLLVAIVAFTLRWFGLGGRYAMAAGIASVLLSILLLIAISRIYITALQDRIIKLEMKLRCAALLTPEQHAAYARLDKPQIVALRFASDAELPALLERADREKLDADQIKRAIRTWVPDPDRT